MLRRLTEKEERLIDFLVKHSSLTLASNWKDTILVEPMNDGGMGSLSLYPSGVKDDTKRIFGSEASNVEFKDKDGIYVLAGLFLDQNGKLFELDIFKGDYSPLIEIPEVSEMSPVGWDEKGNAICERSGKKGM